VKTEKGWRVFFGSFLLLILSYLIYFFRYPMWNYFSSVEPIFIISFLSYFIILIGALLLLKKDSRRTLTNVFQNKSTIMIFVGLFFAIFYLGLWYLISIGLGSTIEFGNFPSLRGYESYSVYYLPLAFILYLTFGVFGAFTEEVAYRGYVQTRISSKFGNIIGILAATLFFSLQHIHVFQTAWIIQFFQTQFFHVFLFSIFGGYLFLKSKQNIWSVFAFHGFSNAYSITVPIIVTHSFPYTFYIAEIVTFVIMILLLYYMPEKTR
jgi:membrane protease YdiL (CAAX protease family)